MIEYSLIVFYDGTPIATIDLPARYYPIQYYLDAYAKIHSDDPNKLTGVIVGRITKSEWDEDLAKLRSV